MFAACFMFVWWLNYSSTLNKVAICSSETWLPFIGLYRFMFQKNLLFKFSTFIHLFNSFYSHQIQYRLTTFKPKVPMTIKRMEESKEETQIPEIVLQPSAGHLLYAGFLVSLFFNITNGGNAFFWKVIWFSSNCMTLYIKCTTLHYNIWLSTSNTSGLENNNKPAAYKHHNCRKIWKP